MKFHLVFGESSSFIGEHVPDHTQVLINTGIVNFSKATILMRVPLPIMMHHHTLDKLDDLSSHNQRYGHEMSK